MGKNVDANKAKESVKKFMDSNSNAGWDSDFGRVPLGKGETLTFTGDVEEQVSTSPGVPNWMAFVTVEGYPIALRQMFRRGNGITYPANVNTPRKAAEFFIDKCTSFDKGLQLKIKEVRKVESSTRDGKNTYYIFESVDLSK